MSQSTEQPQLTATQYVVPVQALQGLPQLAKATAAPSTPPATATSKNWAGIAAVSAIWGCAIWLGLDLAYGGFDKRAIAHELEQAMRVRLRKRVKSQ